ncbi:major royal jelly protein 1-like [Thrips palmi]|uniref:Major royal jelly protein 1-like n=1 Tax=Thrips palmi TaxID=161013 RepID=A0A6P9AG15_THRPL|nr:major royal jelly protein 1-like [Thrips palmi]
MRLLALLLLAACCVSSQSTEDSKVNATESTTAADGVDLGDRFGHRGPSRRPGSSSQHRPGGGGSYHGGSGEHYGGSSGGGSYHGGSHESQKRSPLNLEYGWKKMDFAFQSDSERRNAVRSGTYNYTKIIPLDVDIWEKAGRKKVFVTMPTDDGVPATLATVSFEGDPHAPLMAPYPDWSWHRHGDCRSISSVFRVAVDEYDRLWVMDRGDDKKCLPKLMTFDLNTDRLLSKYEFSPSVLLNRSNLITPVVDVRDNGRNTFVYIADVIGGLIVYDHQSKSAWRVNHPLTLPEPAFSTHTIAGSTFYLPDGVFGLALGPLECGGQRGQGGQHGQGGGSYSHGHGHGHGARCDQDRTLYFHALASRTENHVKTSVLRNRDNFPRGQNRASSSFKSFDHTRPSQSAAQAMSEQGVLFSGLLPDLALMCWNSEQPYAGWNLEVVAKDPETLQFTSGVKVRNGKLWVMSCRYQRFITGTMNWNEVNYRVQSARVADLIRGTKCDPKTNNIGSARLR